MSDIVLYNALTKLGLEHDEAKEAFHISTKFRENTRTMLSIDIRYISRAQLLTSTESKYLVKYIPSWFRHHSHACRRGYCIPKRCRYQFHENRFLRQLQLLYQCQKKGQVLRHVSGS